MAHDCKNSFYVSGVKVRSGQVVATFTDGGVERSARVFTSREAADRWAQVHPGEDTVTVKDLEQLANKAGKQAAKENAKGSGKDSPLQIVATLDGTTARLPFDPTVTSWKKAGFDPEALKAAAGSDYAAVLDTAAKNLPVDPGTSLKYSRAVAMAWLELQSPAGLASKMGVRPGTLVVDVDEVLDHVQGNVGAALAVLEKRVQWQVRGKVDLVEVAISARTAYELVERDGFVREVPALTSAARVLAETAMENLAQDVPTAIDILKDVQAFQSALGGTYQAMAMGAAQAGVERALLEQRQGQGDHERGGEDSQGVRDALAVLDEVCEQLYVLDDERVTDSGAWRTALEARARANVAGESMSQVPLPGADAPAGSSRDRWVHDELGKLDQMWRRVGEMPDTTLMTRGLVYPAQWTESAVEARWGEVCRELDERYGVVASSSTTRVARELSGDMGRHRPRMHDGVPAMAQSWWMGMREDGTVVAYTDSDRFPLAAGSEFRWAGTEATLNFSEYSSPGALLAALQPLDEPDAAALERELDMNDRLRRAGRLSEWDYGRDDEDARRKAQDPMRVVRSTLGGLVVSLMPVKQSRY